VPSKANKVNCTDDRIKGNKIGNDSTGYSVPFAPAFAIIAAIMVEEIARPIFPNINERKNNKKF
jgi:hypothetical protein